MLHQSIFVLPRNGAKRTSYPIDLSDGTPKLVTIIVLRIERDNRNVLAMRVLINEISRILQDVLVSQFASSDANRVRGRARTRRSFVGAANNWRGARLSDIEVTSIHLA